MNLEKTVTVAANLNHLKKATLFLDLSPPALEEVLNAASRITTQANEYLFYEGDSARWFYVLTDGRMKLTQLTPDGHQVILNYVNPGDAFAVIAVISAMAYPVTAEALEYSRLLAWDHKTAVRLMNVYPQIALNIIKILSGHIQSYHQRIRELSTEKVERRIAHTLLRLAKQTGKKTDQGILLDLRLTRQDLGELTGTTIYTVSRILSQWEDRGILSGKREQIIICQPHQLVEIAEELRGKNTS